MYAEVILPLPLYATFTYSVPDDLTSGLSVGSRVLVQFGKKKFYTGIIAAINSSVQADFEIKPIMALLDDAPILKNPQLRLWDWIAQYYLCSHGEVFKAAIPSSLKPESETWVTLNPEFELTNQDILSDHEALVIQHLKCEKKLRLSDLESQLKLPKGSTLLSNLFERGIIEISENISQKYRPKSETFVVPTFDRGDLEALKKAFATVGRAKIQEKILMTYLEMSEWSKNEKPLKEITRAELLERSETSPAVLKSLVDKGVLELKKKITNRFNWEDSNTPVKLSPLSAHQSDALSSIIESFREKNVVLLHGITGSGKTEIYNHLINKSLNDGNQVLFLVPEISLTTHLTDRLRKVFGNRLLVYHSKFSDNERADLWKKLLTSNEPYLILGVRSAVFLPFSHLGLIIVDEEHEPSYKQFDPAPRYNGRDVAIVLGNMHGSKVVLGSATPSVETYHKAKTGKYGLVSLPERYGHSVLPDVEIVDMKSERKQKRNKGILSKPLIDATNTALHNHRQAIFFQNRRGFAPVVICKTCGWTPKCANCDVSLVYHKHTDSLKCHYCGFTMPLPALCPACGENTVEAFGYGTERIAEEVSAEFSNAKVARMDLDTTRNKDAFQNIIEDFSNQKTEILVGTQMVSKGLDFEKVNIVAVLNADTLLNFPDFRSNERAFNMLEQVAGRAGRRTEKGKVIIQTTNPDNEILTYVRNHDYDTYYLSEIEERRSLQYPPFSRVIMVYVKNKDNVMAREAAVLFTEALIRVFGKRVLGPEKPFVSRIATFYLQQIMIKIESEASMPKVKAIIRSIYESVARDSRMKTSTIYYDVDPV